MLEYIVMKKSIHPQLNLINVTDGAGDTWKVLSTMTKDIILFSSRKYNPLWTQAATTQKHENSARVNRMNEFFE